MKVFTRMIAIGSVIALLAIAPVFAQDIRTDYDHNFAFNKMKSYSWGKIETTDPTLEPRITAAVDRVMQGYGFKESDKDKKGDFIFTAVEASNPEQYAAFYRDLNLDWHRGWDGGGFSNGANSLQQIQGGTLVVDIYDAATGKLIWRGTATENIPQSQQTQAKVDHAINTLFAHYPPKSGSKTPPNQQEAPVSPSSPGTTTPH